MKPALPAALLECARTELPKKLKGLCILFNAVVPWELLGLASKKTGPRLASSNDNPNFLPNVLDWTVNRRDRAFHVYVVEPGRYEPKTHSTIFNAALNVFVERRTQALDQYVRDAPVEPPLRFDLVTFPEAFLPPERLLEILAYIARAESFGCVHVGLRPSATDPNHLFTVPELAELVGALKALPDLAGEDLEAFDGWLKGQDSKARFNVGCLFTVDVKQRVRVCLHPKMVQSKYEVSALPEENMEEGNLLTGITHTRCPHAHARGGADSSEL